MGQDDSLTDTKFLRLLQEGGLVDEKSELKRSDCDLIFRGQMTAGAKTITFKQFLVALDVVRLLPIAPPATRRHLLSFLRVSRCAAAFSFCAT